ncbi:hypothetical protein ACIGO8_25325 [Streptomyces sp. NPDC053493]|uniref:hypothetical protein n=1 Tax=Streptomyces sp. NPDC053493 TaxID=3365705 RepID=UPI0037D0C1C4
MRGRGERSVVAVCCWAVVLVALLPGLVLQAPGVRPGAALAVQCVVVAHTGGALTRVLTATSVRLVALGFWLFTYVWLGLAPLAMIATDTYPLRYRAGASTTLAAAVLTELGILAYCAGAAFAAARADRPSLVLEPVLSRRLAPVPVILLCGLALALAVVLIPRAGGLVPFFTSRQAMRDESATADPLHRLGVWVLAVPAFWALVGLVHLPLRRTGDRLLRSLRRLLLPLLLALNVVVNNPISKPRFWAGTVLLVLLFSVPRFNRPRAFRLTAAAVTTVVLFAFPYSDYFRYNEREDLTVVGLTEQFSTSMDYDAFQQTQTGIDYVRDHGISPASVLGVPLFAVPRSMWPDKPEATGIVLAQYAGYDFQNLSAPLWIESYLWGGVPAVVVLLGLFGAAGRRMDDIRERLRAGPATLAVLLVPGFAFYQIILLRGSLIAVVGPLALLLLLPLFITTPAGRSSRSPSSALSRATAVPAPSPGRGGTRDQLHPLR